ncbi:helix-turn-helix transcriptional regulator [Eggerthellaceae bacterium zg-887]|uniref:helix-turn-helix transcriptional regulator n=1 Tax=Xiamenia xianingshaonis TaxID=2682776 RepID=UPI00140B416A|nr:helix-turn-helix transcriptional regulator [Xiamenia xianingshaonis]NHM15728.1 helix-turn-helix transcriptional regulator [Xiamenia xianingshaonis]
MDINLPRISITVNDSHGMGAQGELSTLSLGFGLHQAWIYTAMFGANRLFHAKPLSFQENAQTLVSCFLLISIVTFGLSLLFAVVTDQKHLKFYTAKRVLAGAAVLTASGTFAAFAGSISGALGIFATVFAGISTGIGSALLLLFWGTAYSRHSAATIVMNTAMAIVIAVAIYSFALHALPYPWAGIFTALLPLLELPLLWQLTPVSYAVRHAVPIFNPLPVNKGPFSLRLALPMLLFGFALGALRSTSLQIILPSSDPITQLLALFAGGAATVLLLITVFSLDRRNSWDFLFRPLIPFIAVTLFFLPSAALNDSTFSTLVLLTGYMCFEALMWVFFGEMAQEFRLSPIFVFGVGRSCLAFGSLASVLAMSNPSLVAAITPFGEAGGAMLVMACLIVGYALLPRVRDIRRAVVQGVHNSNAIESFNDQVNQETQAACEAQQGQEGQQDQGEQEDQAAQGGADAATAEGKKPEVAGGSDASASEDAPPATEAPADADLAQANRARRSGRFRMQCEIIADRYLLSRRETEVMFLLAKGYNAAFIQDKLCISKSTAKTHIGHIYRKLDIHNQQELLAMVEKTREELLEDDSR